MIWRQIQDEKSIILTISKKKIITLIIISYLKN